MTNLTKEEIKNLIINDWKCDDYNGLCWFVLFIYVCCNVSLREDKLVWVPSLQEANSPLEK